MAIKITPKVRGVHHARGIKNLSFALSCVDNQHQRQQGRLSTGVWCCLVSIWLSDILLDFISWLERSEFSLKSWQAEQTEFPRYFPFLAANCKEKGPYWALEQQWHTRTPSWAGAEDKSSKKSWLSSPPLLLRLEQALPIPLPRHPAQVALPKAPKPLKPGRSQKRQCEVLGKGIKVNIDTSIMIASHHWTILLPVFWCFHLQSFQMTYSCPHTPTRAAISNILTTGRCNKIDQGVDT